MLVSKSPTTLVFPVEDLGGLPDKGFGFLGPSENTPKFIKRRYAALETFLSPSVREKSRPRCKKLRVRTRGSSPSFSPPST